MLAEISEVIRQTYPDRSSVLDLFGGSGVVANYLRYCGRRADGNDVASFTHVINKANLEYGLEGMARRQGEFDALLKDLNGLSEPKDDRYRYFSVYYSDNSDVESSRMYLTHRNGLFIDAVLEAVSELDDEFSSFVMSDLLLKMMKRSNTNGIFGGFFRQWGGPTAHDVDRIVADIKLEAPRLYEGRRVGRTRWMLVSYFRHLASSGTSSTWIRRTTDTSTSATTISLRALACRLLSVLRRHLSRS